MLWLILTKVFQQMSKTAKIVSSWANSHVSGLSQNCTSLKSIESTTALSPKPTVEHFTGPHQQMMMQATFLEASGQMCLGNSYSPKFNKIWLLYGIKRIDALWRAGLLINDQVYLTLDLEPGFSHCNKYKPEPLVLVYFPLLQAWVGWNCCWTAPCSGLRTSSLDFCFTPNNAHHI